MFTIWYELVFATAVQELFAEILDSRYAERFSLWLLIDHERQVIWPSILHYPFYEAHLNAGGVFLAILSVYDKTGLLDLAKGLIHNKVNLLASGGTAKLIREAGFAVEYVLLLAKYDAESYES